MREKSQTRGRKKKAAGPDEAVEGMFSEMGDLWRRFFQEQMTSFVKAASTEAGGSCFSEGSKSELKNKWQNFIQEEIARCFDVTPVGPLRQYQEKAAYFIQAFAAWEIAGSEFSTLLNRPLAESLADMEQKNKVEKKEIPAENLFPLWIELLEARYLALFRSKEFMASLHGALKAKTALTIAGEKVMEAVLRAAHVPTLRDMDELSREVYLLKKRIQTLERELKDRHDRP